MPFPKPTWEPDEGFHWEQTEDGKWVIVADQPAVDPNPVTAQVVWTNSAGVKYNIEISQKDGVTRWRVQGTTAWADDPTTFYNSLGANIKVPPVTPTTPAPTTTPRNRYQWTPKAPAASIPTVPPTMADVARMIGVPRTAQATPSPTPRYSTKKGRGGRTQGI